MPKVSIHAVIHHAMNASTHTHMHGEPLQGLKASLGGENSRNLCSLLIGDGVGVCGGWGWKDQLLLLMNFFLGRGVLPKLRAKEAVLLHHQVLRNHLGVRHICQGVRIVKAGCLHRRGGRALIVRVQGHNCTMKASDRNSACRDNYCPRGFCCQAGKNLLIWEIVHRSLRICLNAHGLS